VLAESPRYYYLNLTDRHLRSYDRHPYDEKMTALEAFDRFGGSVIEDAIEKGSYPLDWLPPDHPERIRTAPDSDTTT